MAEPFQIEISVFLVDSDECYNRNIDSESMLLRSDLLKIPCQARHLQKGIFELKRKVGVFFHFFPGSGLVTIALFY